MDFTESFLSSLKEYRLMSIGEDYEDVEVRGCFVDNPFEMELSRQIRMNC